MSKRVLCLMADGFEEIETITPVDLLRRAGAEVVLAAITRDEEYVTGRCEVTLRTDIDLADTGKELFDLLLIPGGPGVQALRTDGRAAKLAAEYASAGKLVAAICAAPLVLADAGLLDGKRFTAHSSVFDALPAALGEERVVEDGNLITSRGAGTALDFGLTLVRRLFGDGVREEVATSIMA